MFDQLMHSYASIIEEPMKTLLPTAVFALDLLAFAFIFSVLVLFVAGDRGEA